MICQAAQAGCSNPNTTASDAFSSGTVIRSICNRAANGPSDAISLRVIEAARELPVKQFVFDGELIIPDQPFDALQLRLHPAASRVQKLSREHPAQVVVFDLLADGQGQRALLDRPFRERRAALEDAFKRIGKASSFVLSKATTSSRHCKEMAEAPWPRSRWHRGEASGTAVPAR